MAIFPKKIQKIIDSEMISFFNKKVTNLLYPNLFWCAFSYWLTD